MPRIWSAAVIVLIATSIAHARDVELLALDDANTLVRFVVTRPENVTTTRITGVTGKLIGIDYRPANLRLYGVSDTNDVYTIDRASAVATSVATLTTAFDGGPRSGFDFNPQADRLRLVAASGQNLRVNVDLGAAAVDAPLRYAATDRNAGKRPAIAAAAYTSSVANAPSTKLFDIDADLDVLALQDPPNDGVLVTIGPLGVDFGPLAGFDILTEAGVDRGFACSGSVLYEIDLATGAARPVGSLALAPGTSLIGLAAVPEGASR
jgi:uncharacterized protein DUF4394